MKITLNNKVEDLAGRDVLTVQDILTERKFTYKLLIVKINGQLILKEDYETALIRDGDEVMVLHLITGG